MIYSIFPGTSHKTIAITPLWVFKPGLLSRVALGLSALLSLGACGVAPSAPAPVPAPATASLSQERIAQIVGSADRSAADRVNDLRRKPEQILAFIALRPGMTALDLADRARMNAAVFAGLKPGGKYVMADGATSVRRIPPNPRMSLC